MIYKELHSSCFTQGLALQLLTQIWNEWQNWISVVQWQNEPCHGC